MSIFNVYVLPDICIIEETKIRTYSLFDGTFESYKNLKKHIIEIHPPKIKCVSCEKTFQKHCELEIHIKTYHKETKEYNCGKCDQKFVLKWRLQKHANIHSINNDVKKCHYFNNNKTCPFEENGCMFAHIKADTCKFLGFVMGRY